MIRVTNENIFRLLKCLIVYTEDAYVNEVDEIHQYTSELPVQIIFIMKYRKLYFVPGKSILFMAALVWSQVQKLGLYDPNLVQLNSILYYYYGPITWTHQKKLKSNRFDRINAWVS